MPVRFCFFKGYILKQEVNMHEKLSARRDTKGFNLSFCKTRMPLLHSWRARQLPAGTKGDFTISCLTTMVRVLRSSDLRFCVESLYYRSV